MRYDALVQEIVENAERPRLQPAVKVIATSPSSDVQRMR
jgi:hypothetical protein